MSLFNFTVAICDINHMQYMAGAHYKTIEQTYIQVRLINFSIEVSDFRQDIIRLLVKLPSVCK